MNTLQIIKTRSPAFIEVLRRSVVSLRTMAQQLIPVEEDNNLQWPRKIFSGIQPTGTLHLGNYLGAVQKWTQLQNANEDVTYCVVDMHSITLSQSPPVLRENIFQMAATMLACGIDPAKSTIFVQSAVSEHTELCWILNCLSTMARLGHLPQYKEKTRKLKDIPLGLFVYPVLQAADIMLYKSTHVPVGEDQVQHIQLAQHLAKVFNTKFGNTFPICHAIIDSKEAARIRSLREPSKKMSKSDPDPKSCINLLDEPEVIVEKIKKSMTDFTSDVNYDPETRMGVSNLIAIHSLVTGQPIKKIVEEANTLNTAQYKMRVAEAVVEHLKPIRIKINQHLIKRNELIYVLEMGAEKARLVAAETMADVRQRVGLGANHMPVSILAIEKEEVEATTLVTGTAAAYAAAKALPKDRRRVVDGRRETPVSSATVSSASSGKPDKPVVPRQQMRVEKHMKKNLEMNTDYKQETEAIASASDSKAAAVAERKTETSETNKDAVKEPTKVLPCTMAQVDAAPKVTEPESNSTAIIEAPSKEINM